MQAVFVFIIAVVAMMLFAAATQGYFFARSRLWESAALLLIAFTLFRPDFWLNQVQSPFVTATGPGIVEMIDEAQPGDMVRLNLAGPDFDDMDKTLTLTLPLTIGDEQGAEARLEAAGLITMDDNGTMAVDEPFPGTEFAEKLQDFDFYADNPVQIVSTQVNAERMPQELFYIPALLLLLLVVMLQRRRQTQPAF